IDFLAEAGIPLSLVFSLGLPFEKVVQFAQNGAFRHGDKRIARDRFSPPNERFSVGQIQHFQAQEHIELTALAVHEECNGGNRLVNVETEEHLTFAFYSLLHSRHDYDSRRTKKWEVANCGTLLWR